MINKKKKRKKTSFRNGALPKTAKQKAGDIIERARRQNGKSRESIEVSI